MKTILIRVAIVWLIVGQILVVCQPRFKHGSMTLMQKYLRHPDANQEAVDAEFERQVEYESRREIALLTSLLALDGVIIFFFWNYGSKRKTAVAHRAGGQVV